MQVYSLAVAGATGFASAVIELSTKSSASFNVNALVVPLASAVIGGLMSYAVLRNTVNRMERDVGDIRKEMKDMNDLFRDVLVKIGQLEVRSEGRKL